MSKIIPDLDIVTQLQAEDQFIFWQNSSKKAKRVSRNNMLGSPGIIVKGKVIDPLYGDLGLSAATATNNAATALSTANGAQTSANGKNQIFYSTSSPTTTAVFTGSISGTTLTISSVSSGTVTIGKSITNSTATILEGTAITAFVSGTSGGAGTYTVNLSNSISSQTIYSGFNYDDLWFDTDGGYRMAKWNGASWTDYGLETQAIANLDVGKLTAGFIGSQVIAINGTDVYGNAIGAGGYIESTSFVLTWPGADYVNVKTYNGSALNLGKSVASDVVQVKVLQTDGSYKLFRALADQAKSAGQVGPPASGSNSYWTEITGVNIPKISIPITPTENLSVPNFGFRISSNGYGEFASGLFRGAVIANEGFFGNTKDAVRIDSNGVTIGDQGRVKTGSVGYNGTNFTGGSGFFLGNTQVETGSSAYQFFAGNPSGNYIRWDGASTLYINGNIVGGTTVGTSGGSVGLVMNTQYGIRRSIDSGTLTMTGGPGNGIYYGAQIDMVGSVFYLDSPGTGLTGDDGSGELVLSAGYRSGSSYDGPLDGAIVFRTLREENNSDSSNDGHGGAQRFRIELDGTVRVVYTGNATSGTDYGKVYYGTGAGTEAALNTNPGRFLVEGSTSTQNVEIKAGYITFATDTNLYRSSANTLKTDDDFIAASVTTTSARRTKRNIKTYKGGLDIVQKLKPVSFDRKIDGKSDVGFIAEDVDKVLSLIVAKNEKGQAEGLDYSKITVVLVNAIKELKKQIDDLKGK